MRTIRLILLVAALCFFSNLKSEAQPNEFITNGLIAYYPLNGNANDASGNGNNGTVYGATLTSDRFGNPGMAYEFNGTSDYIAANIPNLPTGSAPRTISLWGASANPINTSCLVFWGTSQNREGFGIIGNGSPHNWIGQTWGGGDDVNSGVVIDGNWHHIVVVYDGSILSICIDGVQTATLSEEINTGFSALTIGADTNNNAPNQFFNGAINDVAIYNRALSTNEIAQLYSYYESQNKAFLTNGLIAYYPFNGNSDDATTNGNNGTPYGISYAPDRFGNPNAAASFAGNSSSYIDVTTTNLDINPPFSVSVWFSYGNGLGGPRIFSTSGYEVGFPYTGDSGISPPSSPINLDGMGPSLTSANTVQAGVWTHVVGIWTTNSKSIYINGVYSGSTNSVPPIDFSRWPYARIGGNSGKLSDDNYGGLIGDLAIYNRALSSIEVAELYQSSLVAGIISVPGILVTGNTNLNYSIQYVTNITSTNWTTLTTTLLQSNSFLYCDTNAVGQPQRFYRVVSP